LLENFSDSQTLVLPKQGCEHRPMPRIQDLPISDWDVHLFIEVKYCDDTRCESQLARAAEQHRRLMGTLKAQGCIKVSLHIILLGVVGAIYKHHTEIPLSKLELDHCIVIKLTLSLHTHSVQYATKIKKTSKKRSYQQDNGNGGNGVSRNPPDPH